MKTLTWLLALVFLLAISPTIAQADDSCRATLNGGPNEMRNLSSTGYCCPNGDDGTKVMTDCRTEGGEWYCPAKFSYFPENGSSCDNYALEPTGYRCSEKMTIVRIYKKFKKCTEAAPCEYEDDPNPTPNEMHGRYTLIKC